MSALQRVAVHLADVEDGRLLLVGGVLPWALLAHGETPAAALARVHGGPGGLETGALLAVVDGRREDDGLDLHTVHLVLAGRAPDALAGAAGAQRVPAPQQWPLAPDADVVLDPAERVRLAPGRADAPVVRQRLACYAVVVSDGALLLTRLSARTPSPGRWTLPGGGVDHGEHPLSAVVREVHEETGMDVRVTGLAEIGAEHFTGRSPRGVLEDFHAVRVLVRAEPLEVREPEVLDVGGSTDLARWVPLEEAEGVGLVGVALRGLRIAQGDAQVA
ncbi:NUDIX domain-containing protein [Kineococcus sp. SYSU DK002]|uniref:NUDIX domain-containing protein n=1 Tax=Kineococcus sp. SYSU DK002 TaxID=3383123 RepID=UPI003D7D164B